MELKDRLSKILETKGLNAREFAKELGVKTPQAVYDLLSGKTKGLSPTMVDKILSYDPSININWLLKGDGSLFKDSHDTIAVGAGSMAAQSISGSTINNAGDLKHLHELEVENASLKARLQSQEDMIAFLKSQIETLNRLLTK